MVQPFLRTGAAGACVHPALGVTLGGLMLLALVLSAKSKFRAVRAGCPMGSGFTSSLETTVTLGWFRPTAARLGQLTDIIGKEGAPGAIIDLATDGRYLYFSWEEARGDIWVVDVVYK